VPGYGALVVPGDEPHGMMTVPAPAAGEIRRLRLVLQARLRSVWVSKDRSQMTHEPPMSMEEPCVYNPYHMLPWVSPECASRNIGNNMKSVYATLQGGGYSNCYIASHHALNLICQSEVIRSAPARLDHRPSEAPSSLVAAETVKKDSVVATETAKTDSVIDISDNESSDSDSDKKPPAKIIDRKKKTISSPQMATKRTQATIPLESDSFSNPSSDKSDEVSSDSEEDTKPKAKPFSLYEQSKMKRVYRQERNDAKRKQLLVTDNSNCRGPELSQMSANDSIKGKSINFSAEVLVAAEEQDDVDALERLHAETETTVKRPLGRRELPTRKVAAVAKASEETKNEIRARASKRLEMNTKKQQSTAVVAAKPRARAKTAKHPNKAVEGNAGNDKVKKSEKTKATVAADRSPKRKKVASVVNSPTPSMQLRSRNQERKEDKERAHQLKKRQQQTEKKFEDLMEESSDSTGGSTSS
jgi:hypothetical protein